MTIFMKIDGIKGEVSCIGHEGWIKLEAANIRVGQSQQPSCSELGFCMFSDIQLIKLVGASMPTLSCIVRTGQTIPKIYVHVCHGVDRVQPHTSYLLSNVVIQALSDVVTGQRNKSLEILSLRCHRIEKHVS